MPPFRCSRLAAEDERLNDEAIRGWRQQGSLLFAVAIIAVAAGLALRFGAW